MTLPVEHAALAGRRVARASLKPQNRRCLRELRQAKRRDGDTAACRRNEGQAQHVDYSSSCFLRLVPASAPRYLAPDALQGLAWETAGGAPSSSSCLGESGPAVPHESLVPHVPHVCSTPNAETTKGTPRVRHTATPSPRLPSARRRRRLQDGCPWRRPPPFHVMIGNIHDRVRTPRGRVPIHRSHRGAAPVPASISSVPSWKTNCATCYTFQHTQYCLLARPRDRTR